MNDRSPRYLQGTSPGILQLRKEGKGCFFRCHQQVENRANVEGMLKISTRVRVQRPGWGFGALPLVRRTKLVWDCWRHYPVRDEWSSWRHVYWSTDIDFQAQLLAGILGAIPWRQKHARGWMVYSLDFWMTYAGVWMVQRGQQMT